MEINNQEFYREMLKERREQYLAERLAAITARAKEFHEKTLLIIRNAGEAEKRVTDFGQLIDSGNYNKS